MPKRSAGCGTALWLVAALLLVGAFALAVRGFRRLRQLPDAGVALHSPATTP
jgi:hypothetical protein